MHRVLRRAAGRSGTERDDLHLHGDLAGALELQHHRDARAGDQRLPAVESARTRSLLTYLLHPLLKRVASAMTEE